MISPKKGMPRTPGRQCPAPSDRPTGGKIGRAESEIDQDDVGVARERAGKRDRGVGRAGVA
jgi:hypothetical protein